MSPIAVVVPPVALLPLAIAVLPPVAVIVLPVSRRTLAIVVPPVAFVVLPRRRSAPCRRRATRHRRCALSLCHPLPCPAESCVQ